MWAEGLRALGVGMVLSPWEELEGALQHGDTRYHGDIPWPTLLGMPTRGWLLLGPLGAASARRSWRRSEAASGGNSSQEYEVLVPISQSYPMGIKRRSLSSVMLSIQISWNHRVL